MANSSTPLSFADAVLAVPNTAVAPSRAIPDNCREVMIWNKGAADALLGIAAPGVGTLVEGVNATRLPTLTALSLGIGLLVTRGIMDQAVVAGSGIVYAGIAGIGSLDITYVCVLGRCTE